jgi:hypothetical protein
VGGIDRYFSCKNGRNEHIYRAMNDEKRKRRLATLIARLEAGNDVARRELQLAVTPKEWEIYENSVQDRRDMKEMLSVTPDGLKPYLACLKRADLLYSRAESMVANGDPRVRRGLYHQSESAYEAAIEVLAEALSKQSDLVMWLDREFSLTPENAPTPDPLAVPRLKKSKSGSREPDGGIEGLTGKRRSLKLSALKSSLESLLQVGTSEFDSQFKLPAKKKMDFSGIKV